MKKDDLLIRVSTEEDENVWKEWLEEKGILKWFPMTGQAEIDDSLRIWKYYITKKSIFTILSNKQVCGVVNLYLNEFKKMKHQCLFAIIIAKEFRGKGIGKYFLEEIIKKAKNDFSIEQLHLEVYENNPAIHLYKKLGFEIYGEHKHSLKENNKYIAKIFMRKFL